MSRTMIGREPCSCNAAISTSEFAATASAALDGAGARAGHPTAPTDRALPVAEDGAVTVVEGEDPSGAVEGDRGVGGAEVGLEEDRVAELFVCGDRVGVVRPRCW